MGTIDFVEVWRVDDTSIDFVEVWRLGESCLRAVRCLRRRGAENKSASVSKVVDGRAWREQSANNR